MSVAERCAMWTAIVFAILFGVYGVFLVVLDVMRRLG